VGGGWGGWQTPRGGGVGVGVWGGWQTPTVEHQDSAFIVLCNTHLMQHQPRSGNPGSTEGAA
jgi:hypothetical protein